MTAPTQRSVAVAVPPGYLPLPVDDAERRVAEARSVLMDAAPNDKRRLVDDVTQAMSVLLTELADRGTRYAGFGIHTSPASGQTVTSTLAVSVLEFPEPSDPRALLELLQTQEPDSTVTELESGRAVLLREQVRSMPAPDLADDPDAVTPQSARVYQFAARVSSADGRTLATIEVSTPSVSDGPTYQGMIVDMAATMTFDGEPAPGEHSDGDARAGSS